MIDSTKKVLFFCGFLALTPAGFAQSESQRATSVKSFVPEYISLVRDVSKYYLYANGGFHADWYIGYNNSWIIKLPPINTEKYEKAFIGAKIGRAKTMSYPMAWDKNIIPGKIYMAIGQTPSFTTDNTYFLAASNDLPREPLPGDYLEGIDSAQWFWAEVPLTAISGEKPNYLAIWSSSMYFVSASSSPIIAAALSDDNQQNVWLNRSIKGSPPFGNDTLETPISGVKPAMAIKLVPENQYRVIIKGFKAEVLPNEFIVSFTAIGEDVDKAWLELSYDKFEWQRITRYMFRPPYWRTFKKGEISEDMFYLRAAATDTLGNTGYSKEIIIPAENTDTQFNDEEIPE